MIESQLLALSAADALAMCLVALLSFALGMIVTILFILARSGSDTSKVDTEIFDEEDEQTFNVEAVDQPKEAPREAWEQDPDWWRK